MNSGRLPYGRQDINQDDVDAVRRVLESDLITQGPVVVQFENALAQYCGSDFAIAVNSATSALHIACMALGVGQGDTVWTVPNTFVASANCARYCLADVDFVDIDPKTYTMCPDALASKLEQAKTTGTALPSVVIVVHFAGQACDMRVIAQLAERFNFKLIEDASHAVGARYENKPVGNCQYSDITVFSFHPVKIVTSGEGGMATTNNKALAEKMRLHRSHGVFRPEPGSGRVDDEPWIYEQSSLGYNYRMTDIHAALGLSQLQRLDEFVERRHQLADRYVSKLDHLPFVLPYQSANSYSALHLYPVLVPASEQQASVRRDLFDYMQSQDIGVNVHYIPVHTQPYYQQLGFRQGDFPASEHYYQRTISLPLFSRMTDAEQDRVVNCLEVFAHSLGVRFAA